MPATANMSSVLWQDPVRGSPFPRTMVDAFGRLRVSNPETIFDSKQIVDKQPLFWDDQLISGSGGASTYNTNKASTTLTVATNTAAVRARQTFRWFNYQPGKSQHIMMTGTIGTPTTGITRRIGYFQTSNGLFFESNATTMRVVIRSNTTGTPSDANYVDQANWNIDKMNGTGASGITANWSQEQIFVINFEWLGVGSVWFGLVIGGLLHWVHRFDNANSTTAVYMSTPNLPLRYEITNDGTGVASGIEHVCSSVMSEGGQEHTGFVRAINRGITPLVTLNNSALYPLIALRLGSNYFGAAVHTLNMSITTTSTAAYQWGLYLNPTITGTALSFSAITNSVIEADVSRTNGTTVTGGTLLATATSFSTNESGGMIQNPSELMLGSTIAGVSDILVLAVQRLTGTTETFYAGMTWRETI